MADDVAPASAETAAPAVGTPRPPSAGGRLWRGCLEKAPAGWPEPAARNGRPGGCGVTMVIDKGVPPGYFTDLLSVAAPYVQLWKLGFGSALLYDARQVAARVREGRQAGVEVYPGGTLLEMARELGDVDAALEELWGLGFRWVEVSDGTFPLPPARRAALIRQALDRGFSVVTEVGSKDPGRPFVAGEAAEQVEADLDSGASFVIIEARDSGRGVGVFDGEGRLRRQRWEALFGRLSRPERVVWEAPQPEQQRELLLLLGPWVNLGNVQVHDILTLAAMRWGLRADTLRVWAGAPEAGEAGNGGVDGPLRRK